MDIIFKSFIPWQSFDYFVNYFETANLVESHDFHTQFKFKLCFVILCIQTLHFFYQYIWFYFTKMNPFQSIMHGDYARISNIPPELYLFVNAICYTTIYFFYILYFPHMDNRIFKLLREILIERKSDFFGDSKHKGKDVVHYMTRFSLKVLNILQGFVIVIGKL